ncbi:MAG: diaminopimelate epimerase [Fibrobacteres bacterium]|nr:diaminopimelate epimerase [Fibrobacterota bacterium]
MKFTKMQGAGNDYVYINLFEEKVPDPVRTAIAVSNRNFGIGADGLILIAPSDKADAKMIMYNADGSMSEMCGNGVRCVAKYVYDHSISRKTTLDIETGAGIKRIELTIENGAAVSAKVNMGKPFLAPAEIPVKAEKGPVIRNKLTALDREFEFTAVGMGNPHCVIFVEDTEKFPVEKYGPVIENHPLFPRRTNVEFIQIISRDEVKQRTWERGSGETLACGTGASAVCVAGVLCGLTNRKILNHLRGGDLVLEWATDDSPVFKTGPAVEVFNGEINI